MKPSPDIKPRFASVHLTVDNRWFWRVGFIDSIYSVSGYAPDFLAAWEHIANAAMVTAEGGF